MKSAKMLTAFAAAVLVLSQFFSYPVFADNYEISGNGDSSVNSVNIESEKSNTVTQENTAEIENNVDANSETGSNEVSDNSGETEIKTGDTTQNVAVVNSGNSNQTEIGCCESDSSNAEVTENGSNSKNQIELNQKTSSNVSGTNNLNLKNNIIISANTGDNEADDNDGDVYISTGKINIQSQILNQNLNSNLVKVPSGNGATNYRISGNGAESANNINENSAEYNRYTTINSLILDNNFSSYTNTGGNKADGNKGKVFITTGSVVLDFLLLNKINSNILISDCCKHSYPSPSPTPDPTTTTDNPSSAAPQGSCCSPTTDIPGPGGGGNGNVGGVSAVLSAVLPATGGFSLWTLTFLALLMLALGVILRTDLTNAKYKLKKTFGEFINSARSYAFGAYLLANLKDVSPSAI